MARNNSRGTAPPAIWRTIFREWLTTFAPILISFSRNVVNVQWRTALGASACNPDSLFTLTPIGVKAAASAAASTRRLAWVFVNSHLPGQYSSKVL